MKKLKPAQKRGQERREGVEVGLAVLSCMQAKHPYFTFTYGEIGEACGVTRQAIKDIERRALKKLRHRVLFTSHRHELSQFLKS